MRDHGRGVFRENTFTAHEMAGFKVMAKGNPLVVGCVCVLGK